MKIQLQYLKSYPQSYAENLIFTYLFRFFFIFHIVSDVVNIYQYAKVYRTTNTGAGASFFPLKCTMCTLYSSIALWSKPEIQKPLSQFLMLFLDPQGPLVLPSVGPSVRPVPR